MQSKHETSQLGLTLMPALEEMVPEDYILRKLNKVLDLGFVHDAVRHLYSQTRGRPSIDPEVIVRLFLLRAIMNISSTRALLREVYMHLGYRWFIGYGLTDPLPSHSTLSVTMSRFGVELFVEIFNRVVKQCLDSGLIEGKMLHIDATAIRADLDIDMAGKDDASDKDAKIGRFPGNRKLPGYKQQTVVDNSGLIIELEVLAANAMEGSDIAEIVDSAIEKLGETPEVLCADSAYANGLNKAECEKRGVRFVSPPRKVRNQHDENQFTIENFQYVEEDDSFICPASKTLKRRGNANKKGRTKYLASSKDCSACPLKKECTAAAFRGLFAGRHHAALVRLRQDSETEEFKELYRKRSPVIEGRFGEAKRCHGLSRAWFRGLSKMRIQSYLIACVLNLKKLAGHLSDDLFALFFRLQSIAVAAICLSGRLSSWNTHYKCSAPPKPVLHPS